MESDSKFYMAGTDKTGEYVVVAVNSAGKLGYRDLGCDFRTRFEPSEATQSAVAEVLTKHTGWKQPDDDGGLRFSRLAEGDKANLLDALRTCLHLMEQHGDSLDINGEAPDWAKKICGAPSSSRADIIAQVLDDFRQAEEKEDPEETDPPSEETPVLG